MLKYIEYFLAAFGIAGLFVYGVIVASAHSESERLLTQYETMLDEQASVDSGPSFKKVRSIPAASREVLLDEAARLQPDKSYWSDSRSEEYAGSTAPDSAVVGILNIPSLELKAPVLKGISEAALGHGVGWLDRTAAIGKAGNAALAAHRDSYFRRLGELEPGAEITLETLAGKYRYVIIGHSIVAPDDVSVLDAETGKSALTLITCYPFYYAGPAPQRYIVHAELIDAAAEL